MTQTLPRRRHGAELKTAVLTACRQPGASVAAIALAHGLNANLVHKWRRKQDACATPDSARVGEFIALALPAASRPVPAATQVPDIQPDIRIQLQRGAATVTVNWPLHGARDCGEWLHQWLK